jgi:hypothetical protein
MRGAIILVVFFVMFTVASLLIPNPMFPGSLLCQWIGAPVIGFQDYLSALFNGVFYGAILWSLFVLLSRRLEAEK